MILGKRKVVFAVRGSFAEPQVERMFFIFKFIGPLLEWLANYPKVIAVVISLVVDFISWTKGWGSKWYPDDKCWLALADSSARLG
jgi:hypothetical protein